MTNTTTTGTIALATVKRDYKIVGSEGKYELEVVGNAAKPWVNPNLAKSNKDYKHSYIVNYKCVELRKAKSLIAAFGGEDKMPLSEFNFGLTKEVIVHHGANEPELPISGETVIVDLVFAKDKEGKFQLDQNGEKILNVRSMRIKPAIAAQSFGSFADFETTAPASTEAGTTRQQIGATVPVDGEEY